MWSAFNLLNYYLNLGSNLCGLIDYILSVPMATGNYHEGDNYRVQQDA